MILVPGLKFLAQILGGLLLVIRRVFQQSLFYGSAVVDLKLFKITENFWLHEVKDRPKLVQVVLERRSSEDQATTLDSQASDVLSELGSLILDLVSFIENYDVVLHISQVYALSGDHAITCD